MFRWGAWYYLIFSLGGTTHYRIAKEPLGPWQKPKVDILDGPEAIVMKSAAFKNNRHILVGFLQHDQRYGGDLVYRELVQDKDGTLGTTIPRELAIPAAAPKPSPTIHLDEENRTAEIRHPGDHFRVSARIQPKAHSSYAISIGSRAAPQDAERLLFDPAMQQVTWIQSDGSAARATLGEVDDLDATTSITLTFYGTVADLSINGHRTLIVADQLAGASQVYNAGGTSQGMFLLGLALHPGMDATSPAHTDPNGNPIPWCGLNPFSCSNLSQHGPGPQSLENLNHLNSNPEAQKTVNILIRNAYKNLTGMSLCCSN